MDIGGASQGLMSKRLGVGSNSSFPFLGRSVTPGVCGSPALGEEELLRCATGEEVHDRQALDSEGHLSGRAALPVNGTLLPPLLPQLQELCEGHVGLRLPPLPPLTSEEWGGVAVDEGRLDVAGVIRRGKQQGQSLGNSCGSFFVRGRALQRR